jgi:hypothetical protein
MVQKQFSSHSIFLQMSRPVEEAIANKLTSGLNVGIKHVL